MDRNPPGNLSPQALSPEPKPSESSQSTANMIEKPSDWRANLPADLQVHPKLKDKDLTAILKDYLVQDTQTCDANGPDDYAFAKPNDADWYDETLADVMKPVMFHHGLSKTQAAAIHDAYVSLSQKLMQAMDEEEAVERQAMDEQIRQTWGPQDETKRQAAQRAADFIGLDDKELTLLAENMDILRLLDALARIGESLDEDTMTNGEPVTAMTAAQANAELARLAADKEHVAAFLNPANPAHSTAKAKRAQLAQIQAGI